jgi:23S rRNA-/tRNA-specific pseudouridylate synthase
VELIDLNKYLDKGDYLRVHHSPKRFPPINNYDWGKYIDTDSNENTKNNTIGGLPGVIVHEDKDAGYIVVNKPPGVPVHPTVGK